LEGDAKQVIDEVISATPNLNVASHFVEGITAETKGVRDVSMVHVGREANNAAHCLAKEASSTFIDFVWLEEIPSCILHVQHSQILLVNSKDLLHVIQIIEETLYP
jgi:hypothetical protein